MYDDLVSIIVFLIFIYALLLYGAFCNILFSLFQWNYFYNHKARDPTKFQHQGYGTLLMEEAERIAREEHGSEKILVISGVGTRHYYRKLGYDLDGPYMSKIIT